LLQVFNATLELRDVTLRHGAVRAEDGGEVAVFGGALRLAGVEIADSVSDRRGGAVFALASDLDVTRSTIAGNRAASGGGVYFQGYTRSLAVGLSTLSGNTASGSGGGLYVELECGFLRQCTLTRSTIAGNAAADGGGLASIAGSESLLVADTLLAANAGGNCAPHSLTSLGGNLTDDASCAFSAASDRRGGRAALSRLGWNGGPTRTQVPAAGSDAIGAGQGPCDAADQRGRGAAAACDSGAVAASIGVCGDGFVDAGEACDPLADAAGCCAADCAVQPAERVCAAVDNMCMAARCDAHGACVERPAPADDCRDAARSRLAIGGGTLSWDWQRGAATTIDDLADLAGAAAALCLYDEGRGSVLASTAVPAAAPGWRIVEPGIDYRAASAESGVTRAALRAGRQGRARLRLQARGVALPIDGTSGILRVQWRGRDGICWQSAFDSRDAIRNDAASLRARAPRREEE
ncbi:MAG: choice-of-anchor Q domain-containing protein, partial [bacterium]